MQVLVRELTDTSRNNVSTRLKPSLDGAFPNFAKSMALPHRHHSTPESIPMRLAVWSTGTLDEEVHKYIEITNVKEKNLEGAMSTCQLGNVIDLSLLALGLGLLGIAWDCLPWT